MPAAASAGSAEPASSDKAPPEISAMCKAVSPRGTDAGGMPPTKQDTLPLDPPLERQICPAVRAGPRNEGRRQTVNAFLYVARMAAQGSLSSGKGNLRRRPPAR